VEKPDLRERIPDYESHQFDRVGAAAVSMWLSLQCPTQRRDFGHTMISGSDCIPHIHSPSASEYAASATLGIHQLSRTPKLVTHVNYHINVQSNHLFKFIHNSVSK